VSCNDIDHDTDLNDMAEIGEGELAAILEAMEEALSSAIRSVDSANVSVLKVLEAYKDLARIQSIAEAARQEVSESPGWIEEIANQISE